MKSLFFLPLLFFFKLSLAQTKKTTHKQTATRDINIVQGNQTIINKYYYTINNFNPTDTKYQIKEKAIAATKGRFEVKKDTLQRPPRAIMGTMQSSGNGGDLMLDNDHLPPFRVTKDGGKLRIDAVLRDSKGDEYGRITNNIWEISDTHGLEYNNDSTALEIRTNKQVVFQLYIKTDTVYINGIICTEFGRCDYLTPQGSILGVPKSNATPRFVIPADYHAPSLFKYPRSEFLGQRENADK